MEEVRFGTANRHTSGTAIHELGHAFGLYHEFGDNGYMTTSDTIARRATAQAPSSSNVKWGYPTVPFSAYATTPTFTFDQAASPLVLLPRAIPGCLSQALTAARIPSSSRCRCSERKCRLVLRCALLSLCTTVENAQFRVPHSLSLKSGFVQGTVTSASGEQRSFTTLVRCLDEHRLVNLEPGKSITDDLVLLRGGQGALFPKPGRYNISAVVSWEQSLKHCLQQW